MLHPHENQSKFLGQQEWVEILMITLVSRQKSLPPNISAGSVKGVRSHECMVLSTFGYVFHVTLLNSIFLHAINKFGMNFDKNLTKIAKIKANLPKI